MVGARNPGTNRRQTDLRRILSVTLGVSTTLVLRWTFIRTVVRYGNLAIRSVSHFLQGSCRDAGFNCQRRLSCLDGQSGMSCGPLRARRDSRARLLRETGDGRREVGSGWRGRQRRAPPRQTTPACRRLVHHARISAGHAGHLAAACRPLFTASRQQEAVVQGKITHVHGYRTRHGGSGGH